MSMWTPIKKPLGVQSEVAVRLEACATADELLLEKDIHLLIRKLRDHGHMMAVYGNGIDYRMKFLARFSLAWVAKHYEHSGVSVNQWQLTAKGKDWFV